MNAMMQDNDREDVVMVTEKMMGLMMMIIMLMNDHGHNHDD